MILVLDTNVYVSTIGRPCSPPGQIEQTWRKGLVTFAVSEPILDEIERVLKALRQWHGWQPQQVDTYIALLRQTALMTPHTTRVTVAPDPDDDKFLVCAVEAQADALITGDKKHLLALKSFQKIPILSPGEFIQQHQWL